MSIRVSMSIRVDVLRSTAALGRRLALCTAGGGWAAPVAVPRQAARLHWGWSRPQVSLASGFAGFQCRCQNGNCLLELCYAGRHPSGS